MKTTKKIHDKVISISRKNLLFDAPISFTLNNIPSMYKE